MRTKGIVKEIPGMPRHDTDLSASTPDNPRHIENGIPAERFRERLGRAALGKSSRLCSIS